jgi:hypothetical protein
VHKAYDNVMKKISSSDPSALILKDVKDIIQQIDQGKLVNSQNGLNLLQNLGTKNFRLGRT